MQEKTMLIFGDSYSTFDGWIPAGYATYYPGLDVTDVRETWWKQLSEALGAKILENNSWSGSTVCNTGYDGDCSKTSSFLHRLEVLIDEGFFEKNRVDHVFVFGGTNDSWSGNAAGIPLYADWTDADLHRILPGFACFIHNLMQVAAPTAIHVIVNTELRAEVTDGILAICAHDGIAVTVLSDIAKESGHPTVRGMTQIKDQILETMNRSEKKGV